VRVAAAGRRQARLSLSRSMMAGGRGHTGHMAHGTAHGTWETVDNGDCRLHRAPYVAITITIAMTIAFAIHRRRPKRARARAIAAPCPVFRYTRKERASWHMHRMLLPSGSGPLLPCRRCLLPAALLPCRQPRALSASLLSPPRLQPEETEEDETRHVVSLQRPAHGDKRSTAPHRTEQTTEGRQHPTAPPRATNGVAVVIPMPAIDDRPVAHRAAIGTM
jgi:hypothetical protein